MKIIRNYILKDFLQAFIFSFLSITTVMILGNLIKLSDMIIRKGVPPLEALKMFFFLTPYLIGFILPLSLLLGVLLSIGRLVSDNELVAINVAGVSFMKIMEIFLIVGIIFSLILFIFNDKILPRFHYNYRSLAKNLKAKNISMIIEPGVFLENFDNFILYVGDVSENKLKNIFIYEVENGKLNQITFAKRGEFIIEEGKLKMKLEEGFQDKINPKNPKEFYRLSFRVFFMDLPIAKKMTKVEKKPQDLTFSEIKEKIKHLKSMNIPPKELEINFHKRISISFSPIIFAILGFGIALRVRHREKAINFGIAFLCASFYYLLMLLGESLAEMANFPSFLSMWLPNLVFLLIGMYLVKNAYFR